MPVLAIAGEKSFGADPGDRDAQRCEQRGRASDPQCGSLADGGAAGGTVRAVRGFLDRKRYSEQHPYRHRRFGCSDIDEKR